MSARSDLYLAGTPADMRQLCPPQLVSNKQCPPQLLSTAVHMELCNCASRTIGDEHGREDVPYQYARTPRTVAAVSVPMPVLLFSAGTTSAMEG